MLLEVSQQHWAAILTLAVIVVVPFVIVVLLSWFDKGGM